MSERSTTRRLTLVIGVIAAVLLLLAAYAIVFEGCQEPGPRENVLAPPDDTPGALD